MKLSILLFVILVVSAVFFILPGDIQPLEYHPEKAPGFSGQWQPDHSLASVKLLAENRIHGPEDVAMDTRGRVYGGQVDGKIIRVLSDGTIETFADTGGRPLGLHFDRHQNLIVADALKGLLSVNPTGEVTLLTDSADGQAFGFTDDLDIAQDGTIYFSDATTRWNVWNYKNDVLEMQPTGRLMTYDPATGQTRTLLDGLYFANGVALSSNEDFVLVNETWKYRIVRFWLKGPKAGTHDIFTDNLPGFPDGISGNRQGQFWLALFSPRNPLLDSVHPYPWIKEQMSKLPEFLKPRPKKYGLIASLDESGRVTASYHDPQGTNVTGITSVEQAGDQLLLGTLKENWIGRITLSELRKDHDKSDSN
ncbi:MAG: gluconolactonase [Gammaproteobacteria bacterium]|nr:MAG: gluconolactonase [Pseudomonadota bacterium]PIE38318.1 MAG: gluconolactonase [Gammaproteobacteria bacterium]